MFICSYGLLAEFRSRVLCLWFSAVPLLSAVPEEVLELDDTVTAQDNLLKLQEELNAEIQEKKSEKQEKQTEDVEEFWIKDPVLSEDTLVFRL